MNADDWTIRAEHLSKKFGLTLSRTMKYGLADSVSRLLGRRVDGSSLRPGEFWAVRDVSFELHRGESLGIMGVNGSGKTTLLRILNGIYAPDVGEVALRGRVGALIAAGAGFAPMLTGRENVFVSGALLGMSHADIQARLDDIIAFSDLGEFIDMPVRHYSSGMFVRLGFAVAAMSEPDILLVDEVLAVGDMNFQKKCFDYLLQLKRNGTSIVLVSHSIGAVWALCERGLLLHRGEVVVAGKVEDVIRGYDERNAESALSAATDSATREGGDADVVDDAKTLPTTYGHVRGGTGDALCSAIRMLDGATERSTREFAFRQPFIIEAEITILKPIMKPVFRYTIDAVHYRFVVVVDSYEQSFRMERIEPGTYCLRVAVPSQSLRPGAYFLNFSVSSKEFGLHLFYWVRSTDFIVRHPSDRFLYADPNAVVHFDADFAVTDIEAEAHGATTSKAEAAGRR